jgi:hypothetical protein
LLATPVLSPCPELDECIGAWGQDLLGRVQAFLDRPVTPTGTCQFERDLSERVRSLGRVILEWALNHLEPTEPPAERTIDHEVYRLRPKSPRRHLDSLFGPVRLWRYRYEASTPGEPSRFPLEERLGLEGQRATPALAERAAWWSVGHTQAQVLAALRREYGVAWSVPTLRRLTASVSAGMSEHREAAQAAKLHEWLRQAETSAGPHRPVVSVGRDGVMVPVRGEKDYREAATGTMSVIDRRGRRLGTVYLGRMPESGQKTLSRQMTSLLLLLVASLTGPRPRLHYVTDGGGEPTRYFRQVLRKLRDPRRPGRRLTWTWVIDFYHACGYITKMSEALSPLVVATSWARKMRHWLRDKRNGAFRVLHSAAALRSRSRRRWTQAEQEAFREGYRYLRKRKRHMDYAGYRARGLPIGSGVTEAACKTVFTQRLKQSGMTWEIDGGQIIVDLRTIWLSGVWQEVHTAYLAAKAVPETGTQQGKRRATRQKVA